MDLTPPTTTADAPADPVTAAVAANPRPLGLGLLAVGLLGLLAGVYFGYQAYSAGRPPADAPEGEAPIGRLVNPGHVAAAVTGLLVALVGLGVGAVALARVPADTEAGRRTEARTLVLTGGGLLGLVVLLAGGFFLYLSFGTLTEWLDTKTPPKDAWKPVAALLAVLAGAGLAFLSAQPARAEERNNPFLRRLVYGGNLALASLLLLLALVVANVLAGLKVPNKLDTTEGGFYSLADATKTYLAELTKPVTLYTTIPEGGDRIDSDIRSLLDAMREANPRQVTVVPLSPTLNRKDITDLRNRFPQADIAGSYGVLVAVGEKGKEEQAAFVRDSDMIDQGMGRGSSPSFTGESKIVKELLFLTESKTKPVVYALTGHGELEVVADPAGGADAVGSRRTASRVRAALEKVNVEVRPLALTRQAQVVPDDAGAVLILDPRTPVSEPEAAALKTYLTKPRADGKTGKLILAAGPVPRPDRTGVAATGLEDVLTGLGVKLGTEYIVSEAIEGLGYTDVLAAPSARLIQSKNPVAAEFMQRTLILPNCREVTASPAPPPGAAPGPTAELFLGSYPPNRISWFEPDPPLNPGKLLDELLKDENAQRRKRASQTRSRSVAVIVSQGETGRALVVGSGEAFADPAGRSDRREEAAADLIAVSVNWLRDRPAVANIAAKDYRTYTLDRKTSDVALVWLPVGATLAGVLALGLGVWVFRRK